LASDNPGPLCSPCWQRELRARANTALRRGSDAQAVRRAFLAGGVPAIADALRCSSAEALEVALLHKLVPAVYRRRTALLVQLLELGPVAHVVAGEQLNLSRWTVATYRRDLGIVDRGRPAAASPATRRAAAASCAGRERASR
jgi:hypothetical protein